MVYVFWVKRGGKKKVSLTRILGFFDPFDWFLLIPRGGVGLGGEFWAFRFSGPGVLFGLALKAFDFWKYLRAH